MPSELKGEALLDYYREAVRACYDDEIADASFLVYHYGWYQIGLGKRRSDGSIWRHDGLHPTIKRAAEVREMANELYRRAEEANGD